MNLDALYALSDSNITTLPGVISDDAIILVPVTGCKPEIDDYATELNKKLHNVLYGIDCNINVMVNAIKGTHQLYMVTGVVS